MREPSILAWTDQENPVAVRPGDVLAGKYRVERILGVGGMGAVVAAHHIQLDEPVALKFLLPHALRNPEAGTRFLREARAAVKIKSEHVARVSDVGELENGAPYMVMEFLQGGDLSGWLEQNGPLPVEQAIDFVLQACVALADAHVLGIVHRDLKPANLFCVRRSDGQLIIKVLDFGISKTLNLGPSDPTSMTKTSANMGTPLYMSPEQMRSARDVDGGTDLWALGVILFELLTGQAPFNADSLTELVLKVATDPTPSLRKLRPDAPAGLEAVIGKCLQKDRAWRYRNVAELAAALAPFAPRSARVSVNRIAGIFQAAGLPESALAVPVSAPAGGKLHSPNTALTLGRTTAGTKFVGSKTVRWVGAGLGAAAVIAAAVYLGRHSGAAPPVTQPAQLVPPAASEVPSATSATPAPAPDIAVSAVPAEPPAAPSVSPPATAATPAIPRPASSKAKPPAPAPRCNPPYVIDANGDRQYKPECLRR